MCYVQTAIKINVWHVVNIWGEIRKEQPQNSLNTVNTVGMTKKIGASQIYFIEPLH